MSSIPVADYPAMSFLSDPGKPGVRSLGPDVCPSVTLRGLWDSTDVTLADEDTKSKLTDNAKKAIQGNEAMQAMQTGDQCKFATIGSGASWWPNLQPILMVPSDGKI